ncbi:5-oxoprolinase subunit PxpB [Komagataeibacter xylinus]|nr:5-oxoprolinase subunit PxpB [Komagataeibacter xylinus]
MEGAGALLLDIAGPVFDECLQRRIWDAAQQLEREAAIIQAVPGVNNLLVTFDVLHSDPDEMTRVVQKVWKQATPHAISGREIEIPVIYDGETGEDLAVLARHAGLCVAEVIKLHASARYSVAAIGAMPGFVYLTGLDSRLALPRRDTPRLKVEKGAVIIGGGHAGIMPCTAPSGWHVIGHTDVDLFDPSRSRPCFLQLGDSVRFVDVT